jgi:hypothetical protein
MPAAAVAIPLIAAAMTTASTVYAANKAGGQSSSSSSTPTLDPKLGGLQDNVLASVMHRLENGADLSGYTRGGQQQINAMSDLSKQAQANNLTARGLASSPVAATVDATREAGRTHDMSGFLNSIPMLRRDLQTQDIGIANNILGQGRGISTTGQTTIPGGSGLAAGLGTLGPILAQMAASGAFGGGAAPLPSRSVVPNYGYMPIGGTSGSGMGGY